VLNIQMPKAMYGWVSGADTNDNLVNNLKKHYSLSDRVTAAMKRVDRANYCQDKQGAYDDSPQFIGFGQTISAPHVHALALRELEPNLLEAGASVLDVGSGSGIMWRATL
jgi:protein-L-isoaspartate(D-aspartate) O-methyltransferase